MKVALINMPFSEQEYLRFSEKWSFIEDEYIGINIVHSLLLSGGWDVTRCQARSLTQLLDEVFKISADIVMISVMQSSAKIAYEFVVSLRQHNYNGKIFIGGWFAKLSWKYIFETKWPVDYVCYTDAEGVFPTWMKSPHTEIYGIATYQNWNTLSNEGINILRDKNEWPNTYISPIREAGRKTYRLETSRGCPHSRCTFCSLSRANVAHGKWSPVPLEIVLEEIKSLYEKFGATRFSLTDDDMLGPLSEAEERAKSLHDIFRKLPFKIKFSGSISVRAALNGNILDMLVDAGIEQLGIGFESADEEQLRRYCKQQTIEENFLAAKNIVERSISLIPGLITFDPFATTETIKKNLLFLYDTLHHYDLGKLTKRLHVIQGTPIEEIIKREGLLLMPASNALEYKFKYPETERIYNDFCTYTNLVADLQKIANVCESPKANAVGFQHRLVAQKILANEQWQNEAKNAVENIQKILGV